MTYMTASDKRNRLRAILKGSQLISPATVYDALSARVAESVGFETGILSGSVCAATLLAAPDLALQTLTEFAAQVRIITRAGNLSLFVDADQGYGNALNVMRTVEELEHAGLAGLAIEDLVMPSPFGAHGADKLISIPEMLGKLRAALSARRDPSLVIVARTAALRTEPIDKVVARVREYAGSGVDGVFVTTVKKLEDLDAICAAVKIPVILGSAPLLKRADVAVRGVRFCLQGHAALAASAKALRDTYTHFRSGGTADALKPILATPEEMSRLIAADKYAGWSEEFLN